MSLINSVLRDLANRQAKNQSSRPWQKEIRALPMASKPETKRPNLVITGLFIASVSGALGYQIAHWRGQSPATQTLTQSVIAPPEANADPAPIPSSSQKKIPEVAVPTGPSVQQAQGPVANALPQQSSDHPTPENAQRRSLPNKSKATIQKLETPTVPTPRALAEQKLAQANTLVGQGQTDAAIAACYTALDHDPSYVAARQRLLGILERNGRQDEAAIVVADGLNQSPAQVGWALWLSRYELKKGNIANAALTLKRSENFAKKNADYSGFQGHLALRQGDNGSAVQYYRNAVTINPRDGRWWFGLGDAMSHNGDKAGAAEAFRNALSTGNLPATLADIATQRLNQ